MGAIKRNITDISNLKRGDVQMSKVYRGDILIWTNAPTASPKWLTTGLAQTVLNEDVSLTSGWITNGINTKFN